MIKTVTLLMIATLLIFSTARAGQSSIKFAGGPGDSPDNAVIIKGAPNSVAGIQAESRYLQQRFGQENNKWRMFKKDLIQTDGKTFEVITIEMAGGAKRDIYFDISGFFGKY